MKTTKNKKDNHNLYILIVLVLITVGISFYHYWLIDVNQTTLWLLKS